MARCRPQQQIGSESAGNEEPISTRLSALRLTRDHTPLDPGERERLSRVSNARIIDGRVNGQLEVSRSFGDYQYKGLGVSCLPDVKKYELVRDRDRYISFGVIFWSVRSFH